MKGKRPTSHGGSLQVSDNREIAIQTDPSSVNQPPAVQGEVLKELFAELRAIRSRMDKLDKIEASTTALTNQIGGLVERTVKLEHTVETYSSKLHEVNEEVASLSASVGLQGEAIAKLTTIKADISRKYKATLGEMNELIGSQKKEAEDFRTASQHLEENIIRKVNAQLEVRAQEAAREAQKKQAEDLVTVSQHLEETILQKVNAQIEERAQEASQEASFRTLKGQAFSSRFNLVVTGLKEDSTKSTISVAKDLFQTIGVEKPGIADAFRVGSQQKDNSSYRRPLVVKFSSLPDRNKIWRKRSATNPEEGNQRVRIQADLPKMLREETHILYRIKRAAAKIGRYKTATVRNCAIQLPITIRPSTISNPRSEEAIAFFTKYSVLSNHHPSVFTLNGQDFQNMEQFLAFQRAKLSGQQAIIQRAVQTTDAKEAKAILHSLREDHEEEWSQQVEATTIVPPKSGIHNMGQSCIRRLLTGPSMM